MNISAISGLGNIQQTQFKKNNSIRLKTSNEVQRDAFQPSFKSNFANAKNVSKALFLPVMLGLTVLSGACKKPKNVGQEVFINNDSVDCMCESRDFTEISRNFVNIIPEDDIQGRTAYLEWYNANIDTIILDPKCCHHILPKDPNWETKCMNWISDYLCCENGE